MQAADNFRTMIVVNPRSANGSTKRQWPSIRSLLKDNLGDFDFAFTCCQGDATRITGDAISQGYEMIVSLGGDGTHNEVVNGFFDGKCGCMVNPDAVFGLISSGTGGDFRKTVGLRNWQEAAGRLKGKKTRKVDLGRLTFKAHDGAEKKRIFLNIASFGAGGEVDEMVNSTTKAFGGFVSFMAGSLRALITYKNKRVMVSIDGAKPKEAIINNVAVANGRFFGGGMMIAPQAEIDDGLFDIVTIGELSFLNVITNAPKIYKGTHLSHPKITHARGQVLEASSNERVLLDVDGEQPGMLPARFELLHAVLNLKA